MDNYHEHQHCTMSDTACQKAFQRLFYITNDPLLLTTPTGVCVQANAAAQNLWQLTEVNLVGSLLADLIKVPPSQSMPPLPLSTDDVYQGEGCIKRVGGEAVSVAFTLQAYLLPDRHLLSLEILSPGLTAAPTNVSRWQPARPRDEATLMTEAVTISRQHPKPATANSSNQDRERLETNHWDTAALLKNVLDRAPAAIVQFKFFADHTVSFTYLSEEVEAVFGYSKQHFLADPQLWAARVFPADRVQAVTQAIQGVPPQPYQFEYQFRVPDGSLRWINSRLTSSYKEAEGYWLVTTVEINISDRKQAELALEASEYRFRSVLENMPLLGVLLDPTGNVTLCNDSLLELTGWSRNEILQHNWVDFFVPPELRGAAQSFFQVNGQMRRLPRHSETEVMTRWGERRLIAWRNLPIRNEQQQTIEYACIGEDITERRRSEVALQRQAMQEQIIADITHKVRQTLDLKTILTTAVNAIKTALSADRVVIFQFATAGAGHIIADTDHQPTVFAERATQIGHWLDRATLPQALKMVDVPIRQPKLEQKRQIWGLLIAYLQAPPEGSIVKGQAFLRPLADQLAIAIHQSELYTQAQQELQERQQIAVKYRYDALHDALTGLANRKALHQRLEKLLASPQPSFALLFLDLNQFKQVNDTYGHLLGDQLLQIVAQRLQFCIRDRDLCVRLGGDEFILLINPISRVEDAVEVAQRVTRALAAPSSLFPTDLVVSASIGIAISSEEYSQPDDVIADADRAMYDAKRYHKPYVIYGSNYCWKED
jgi:diguanylate cyclase (GGDEF)-like protein/PAS domain S-box-containing protein